MFKKRTFHPGCGVLIALVIGAVGWYVYGFFYTLKHLPEAYAAWDSATLIIEYLETHDRQWPRSWDDLVSLVEEDMERRIPLRGASIGDVDYARSLQTLVTIDWTADPEALAQVEPRPLHLPFQVVTRIDGTDFPIVWEGVEPNSMIWRYLRKEP